MPKEMIVDKNPDAKGLRQVVSFHDKTGKEVHQASKDAVTAIVAYYDGERLVRRGTFSKTESAK